MMLSGLKPDRIVTFGCPRPAFAGFRKFMLAGGFPIRSYKNRHDPVTDVPFLMGLYKRVTEPIKLDVFDWRDSGIKEHGIDLYVAGLEKKSLSSSPP